jgi:MFS family permease
MIDGSVRDGCYVPRIGAALTEATRCTLLREPTNVAERSMSAQLPSRLWNALPFTSRAGERSSLGDTTFRALKHRNYRLFYFGQCISLSGTWMQTVAQAVLVLEISDSKVALGTVAMLQFLPITLFVLFAGVLADRVPKRELIVATRVLAMLQAIVLAALVWSGNVELWHVYVLAFVLGVANAFEQPARQAFVVEMVGRDDLMNAVALNSGMFNLARLIGPAIGGLVIAAFGVKWAFTLNALSFLPVMWALLAMNMAALHTSRGRATATGNPFGELRDGIAFVLRTPPAMLIMIMMAAIGTFGINFTVMLPLVNRYVLDRGAAGLGFMTSAVGLGALVAAFTLASRERITRRTLFAGALGFSLLLLALAFSELYFVTLLILVGMGVANITFASTANTSLQLTAPDELRGRVMSLYMLLLAGSTPIGGYLTGVTSEAIGVSAAVAINGLICLLGVGAGGLYYMTHRAAFVAEPEPTIEKVA